LRVLILTAPYGDGHNRAAEAIEEAFAESDYDTAVTVVDYFNAFVSDALVAATRKAYINSISKAPAMYGVFYRSIGALEPDSKLRRTIDSVGRKNFKAYLDENPVDVVISLYPIPSGALSQLKERGLTEAVGVTVVTDYTCHPEWLHSGTDAYVVGSDAVAEGMAGRGVERGRIHVLGIPVRAAFRKCVSNRSVASCAGPVRPRLLVMAGAFGTLSGLRDLLEVLRERCESVEVTFVCGRSTTLLRRLEDVAGKWPAKPRVLGFVQDVASEMVAADLLISKAGGITVSEALAVGRGVLVFKPIPGQEAHNAEFLEQLNAGLTASTAKELAAALDNLLADPEGFRRMAKAASRAGKPSAAPDVVRLVTGLAEPRARERCGR